MFKIEWKRMLKNPFTYVALAVGLAICIVEIVENVIPELEYFKGTAMNSYPDTVFSKGILFQNSKIQKLYYTIVPLLAVIPSGVSFYNDMESGYIRQIITRGSRTRYYTSKYAVAFISGGLAAIIPLIINLMVCMAVFPSAVPQPGILRSFVSSGSLMCDLFFTVPYVYTVIYLLIDFVIWGTFVTFAVGVSWFAFSRYLSLFTPFIVYYVLHFVFQYMGQLSWSPFSMIFVNQGGVSVNPVKLCIVVVVLLASSVTLFVVGGKKNEVL